MNYYALIVAAVTSIFVSFFIAPFHLFMFGSYLVLGYLFMTVLLGAVIYDTIMIAKERFFG